MFYDVMMTSSIKMSHRILFPQLIYNTSNTGTYIKFTATEYVGMQQYVLSNDFLIGIIVLRTGYDVPMFRRSDYVFIEFYRILTSQGPLKRRKLHVKLKMQQKAFFPKPTLLITYGLNFAE